MLVISHHTRMNICGHSQKAVSSSRAQAQIFWGTGCLSLKNWHELLLASWCGPVQGIVGTKTSLGNIIFSPDRQNPTWYRGCSWWHNWSRDASPSHHTPSAENREEEMKELNKCNGWDSGKTARALHAERLKRKNILHSECEETSLMVRLFEDPSKENHNRE